jgi:hypothetical protein
MVSSLNRSFMPMLHYRARKSLTMRNLKWRVGLPLFRLSGALRKAYGVGVSLVDLCDVADHVLTRPYCGRFSLSPSLRQYFSEYGRNIDDLISEDKLTLNSELHVFRLADAYQSGYTGGIIHGPSQRLVKKHGMATNIRELSNNFYPRRPASVEQISGPAVTLLGGRLSNGHYGHFLLDRFRKTLTLLESIPKLRAGTLVVRDKVPAFQETAFRQLLNRYKDLKIKRVSPDMRVEFEELYLATDMTESPSPTSPAFANGSYPDQRRNFCRFGQTEALKAVGDLYREAYGSNANSAPCQLYVSRNRFKSRKLANEQAVWEILEREGFQYITPETMPHKAQVALFAQARDIFAPSGSAITNVLFCNEGARLILTGPSDIHVPFWVGLALSMGLDFAFCPGSPAGAYDVFSVDEAAVKALF